MSNQSRIIILPEDLVNKIAAGEVVERPASVVKELVENSIDAGATRISIEVKEGGKRLIRVTDNGWGMTKEEVRLALERYSTSKIKTIDDLFSINSLGFRGEALPSMASVSKLEIISSSNQTGTRLKAEGGKVKEVKDCGCPPGTTVIVRDLFYNTPARLKFLKTTTTEIGRISDRIDKFILAHPHISFKLIHNESEVLSSSGNGKLMDSLVAVYGVDLVKELLEVNYLPSSIKISGFISKPVVSRIDRGYESYFVNQRLTRSPLLCRALEEAYRTLLPKGRYPIAVIFIDLPPSEVDVNVHPGKREVRFMKANEVLETLKAAAQKALESIRPEEFISREIERPKAWIPEMTPVWKREVVEPLRAFQELEVIGPPEGRMEMEVTAIQPLIPITQFKDTYIVATDGVDLILIDQHAAHERIIYDQLQKKSEVPQESQGLLIPETLELTHEEALILEKNLEYISKLGFKIEPFGKDSFIIRSQPAILGQGSPQQLILDIVSELQTLGKSREVEVIQEKIHMLLACHGAIKAGDRMREEEMSKLIRDVYSTENPLTCPHGRPTMIRFSSEELEKLFKRK